MYLINGKILTMAGNRWERGYIRFNRGKIQALGDMAEFSGDGESEEILDVKGAWVLPGLIDAHCHVGIAEEKGGLIVDDSNEMTNPLTPQLRAIDGINPMDPAFHDAIGAGITSLMTGPGSSNVVGGQSVFLKTRGRVIDDMIVKAPAAMKVAFGENPKTNYGQKDQMPGSRMGIGAMLREELFKARIYREKKERGDLEEENFHMECYLPVLKKEIPLKAHVHRADDILTAIRIAKEFDVDMTLDHCTEGFLIGEEIRKSGFPAIAGPLLTSRSKIEVKYLDFKNVGVLNRAGVKTAIMTDHPVSLVQYLPLCVGLSVKHGLDMEEGFLAMTRYPAEICGVADRVGTLEPGKDADIAVFSGNPMEVFTRTLFTIINGEIVYRDEDSKF